MRSSGKLVVLSIFAVAIAMAGFALWWNWGQGRRSLEFWGTDGGLAIRDAKQVQLLKLKPLASEMGKKSNESLAIDSHRWEIVGTKDVTGVHGLVHARHAFLEDASFRWEEPLPIVGPEWQYAVRFQDETGHTTISLDLKSGAAGSWEQKRAVRLSPKTTSGWKQFISRYFPDDAAPAQAQ